MPHFGGFQDVDFETLDGSKWRSRDALGGVLARALHPAIGAGCQSWGVRRRVELHIARTSDYVAKDPRHVAKLFVYTHDELAFGFYVEATGKRQDDDHYVHWRNFRDRIQTRSALRDALECAIAKHDLAFGDYYCRHESNAAIVRFRSMNGRLYYAPRGTDNWTDSSVPDFARAVAAVPEDKWVNLHIYAHMSKETAIAMAENVVGPILLVLDDLVPVYLETVA